MASLQKALFCVVIVSCILQCCVAENDTLDNILNDADVAGNIHNKII